MTPEEHLQARYGTLEGEWAALKRRASWHEAWGLANALAWIALAVLCSADWQPENRQGMAAVMLAGLGSLAAQWAVWRRGHRARRRVLSEYQRTNEELQRQLREESD